MAKKVKILGVAIDNVDLNEALGKVRVWLQGSRQHYIVTPNPEFIITAQKDISFRHVLEKADLAVADGTGLILASWLIGQPLKGRVVGVDFMDRLCCEANLRNWQVFLLGGQEGISQRAASALRNKYAGLEIEAIDNRGISDIKALSAAVSGKDKPSLLFLALGTPKQEKWIYRNLGKIETIKLAVGVGGAFDFLAGRVPRSPYFLRAAGLEWLWRLACQPWRIKRIFKAVVVFPYLVAKEVVGKKRR